MSERESSGKDIRIGNADRTRVVEQLREHTADGRLTLDEFSDRVSEVYAAKTVGDLELTMRELPTERRVRVDTEKRVRMRRLREHVAPYVITVLICVAIWAMTGFGYFWPIWVIVPWGIGVLSHAGAAMNGNAKGEKSVTEARATRST
jgi:hypothetical protein